MTQYGMGDEETINEVLDEVDTDKVSNNHKLKNLCTMHIAIKLNTVHVIYFHYICYFDY